MPSYATPADMLNFYDVNTVGRLVNNTGTPEFSQLLTDPNLAAIYLLPLAQFFLIVYEEEYIPTLNCKH